MTLEQALKRIQDKISQITKLEREIADTKAELKNLTPLKVGSKVLVDGDIECYIADVEWEYSKPHWKYKFNKIRKDGTMSGQSVGIYRYNSVELIKTDK
jgi:hypothetical protein